MKVGVLGSGDVGRSLANGFLATGRAVCLGTGHSNEEKVQSWRTAAGPKASVGSFAEAARFGDVVALAVRGTAAVDVVAQVGADALAGKTLLDVTNPLEVRPNRLPGMFVGLTDSLGERVQRAAPGAHVVKVFNIVGNTNYFRPKFPGGPPTMFYCGDDAGAKKTVAGILDDFGWTDRVDIGGIAEAGYLEALCLLWVRAAMATGDWEIAFRLERR